MRRRDKDDALYVGSMIEYQRFFQELSTFAWKDCFRRRFAEVVTPNPVAHIGDQKTAD